MEDNIETKTDEPTSQDAVAPNKPKRSGMKRALIVLLVLILAAGASGGVYAWQHSKVTTANSSTTKLNSQVATLKKQAAELKTKNGQLQTEVNSYQSANGVTQDDLKIAIASTTYKDSPFCSEITTTPAFAAIDMTVSNPTKSPIHLTTASLKLKDAQSNTYLPLQGTTSISACINGYTVLTDQTLAPGETVRGALMFQVPNTSITSFTLVNGTKSVPVSMQ